MNCRSADLDDRALIGLTLEGQTECFNVLIARHQSAVRRWIKSMTRNKTEEDDLVQEVFLKAWRHLASFRSEANFRTWITRIATNEVLQLFRRESRRQVCAAAVDFDTFTSRFESPQRFLERAETNRIVRGAIGGLPEAYSQILVLRDLEQLSENETARRLQGSVAMVKTRLFRARRLLLGAIQTHNRKVPKTPKRMTNPRMVFPVPPISRAA